MKRPVNKKIIEALEHNFSILVNTAQELGCARQVLKKWIDNDPELQEAYLAGKEKLKDMVEFQLLKNIKEGKETSLIWYMKTQMKDRGYIDRSNLEVTGQIEHKQLLINVLDTETKLLMEDTIKMIDITDIKKTNE